MAEINILDSFPKAQRKVEDRTEKNKLIARRYDKEFFDGDRINGYGGYYYDGRWKTVVKKLQEVYGINSDSAVLDIGCAKGFLLYDLQDMIPGIRVAGLDISEYALNHALDGFGNYMEKQGRKNGKELEGKISSILDIEETARQKILPFMIKGSADKLPYVNDSFDVVLSINTTHNLPRDKFKIALEEMARVCRNKRKMFLQVDAYRNPEEKARMEKWALTADTFMSAENWLEFFKECNYKGDYFWTVV
jgi:SAM-dependent methyltransferase